MRPVEDGLEVSVVRAQRIYNNHRWPNPIVVKLEHVEPAFIPPAIRTLPAMASGEMSGELIDLGDETEVQVGFKYRLKPKGLNDIIRNGDWQELAAGVLKKKGTFQAQLPDLPSGRYQIRAVVRHNYISIEGAIEEIEVP